MLAGAALELRCGVQQQQHAGEVFIELIQADLFQFICRVADDDVILAFVLFACISLAFFFLHHMLAAGIVILDGRLFEDDHKVGQALVGNDLRNCGQGEIA